MRFVKGKKGTRGFFYHGSLTEEGKLSRVDLLVKRRKCIYNEKYVWTDEEIFL
jgi:hypothetical protein